MFFILCTLFCVVLTDLALGLVIQSKTRRDVDGALAFNNFSQNAQYASVDVCNFFLVDVLTLPIWWSLRRLAEDDAAQNRGEIFVKGQHIALPRGTAKQPRKISA